MAWTDSPVHLIGGKENEKVLLEYRRRSVISLDEIDTIRQETEPETPLETYVENCSYLNNGDLEPLEMEIEREQREGSNLLDDIRTITNSIQGLAKLATQNAQGVN